VIYLKIYNISDKLDYLDEICSLTLKEWGSNIDEDFDSRVYKKKNKIINSLNNRSYCKLVLLDDDKLVGFISMFPTDGDERCDLSPWYATMYVKKEYRGKGYSKILNDAILYEAKNRGFSKIYLKSDLINYYEKFGAVYMEDLKNGEKLYYIDLKK
jgi:GNAT superfamily N-acetyltransferase